MCTAIKWHSNPTYCGRNLDLEYDFEQEVVITPRNYELHFKHLPSLPNHYAMIGMANVTHNYPLYAEAVNEVGLFMAGLYLPHFTYYQPVNPSIEHNVAPYELIPWLLGRCQSVAQALPLLKTMVLIDEPFAPHLPVTALHWFIADAHQCYVIEATKQGVTITENPIEVLTNAPTFDFHLLNLQQFRQLSAHTLPQALLLPQSLAPHGQGSGALGLPGDWTPASRFVRAAFVKSNTLAQTNEPDNVMAFFHMLQSVAFPQGSIMTAENLADITRYSCCCNLTTGSYYYQTYFNQQVTELKLQAVDLNVSALYRYPLVTNAKFQSGN